MLKAERAYLKAVECDPNSFDSNFNLGAVYNNWGNWYSQSGTPSSDNDKKAKEYWNNSILFLEKCVQLRSDDKNVVKNLIRIYRMADKTEKATAATAKQKAGDPNPIELSPTLNDDIKKFIGSKIK